MLLLARASVELLECRLELLAVFMLEKHHEVCLLLLLLITERCISGGLLS